MVHWLAISDITHSFDGQPVLRGITLTAERGEIICLLGASGSGKTTLLRIIVGLEQPASGDVLINGTSLLPIPVHQRGVGLMFQDYALFPHLNVRDNVAFGLKMRGDSVATQQQRLDEVLALVGLSGFEGRAITALSGGERQRVALARSLAPEPRLLLLDEPLGSLDAALRERLALDLRAVIKQAGLTALYVTHDQQEAFAIADGIAIMHAGRIEQIDTPPRLYRTPQTAYVARFLGLNNLLPILSRQEGMAQTALGAFPAPADAELLLLHPAGIQLDPDGAIALTVRECVFLGDAYRVTAIHLSGTMLTFKVPYEAVVAVEALINVTVAPSHVVGLAA
ncbi:MAG: ABC transporter ATP-binding protein [Armatimonadetes bacterium]|nr:ABC transporter ATP-binding protein [Anaerolineae bacterium]